MSGPHRAPAHPDNVEHGFDFAELDGFTFSGRELAIEKWRQKKEQEEFDRLCESLRVRKWQRENHERRRAYMRAHYQANAEHYRAQARRRYQKNRERELARHHRRVVEARSGRSCRHCGASLDHKRNGAMYCTKRCGERARSRRTARPSTRAEVVASLRVRPWQTLGEVVAATCAKKATVASALTRLVQSSEVVTDGKKRGRRYALAGAEVDS